MKKWLSTCCILATHVLPAQPLYCGAQHLGIPAAHMAETNVWSAVLNPAGMAGARNAIAWGAENRFGLRELHLFAIVGTYAHRTGTFGLQWQQFGVESFQTQTAALGYARKLGKVQAGVRFRGWHIQQGLWGIAAHQLGADLGLQYPIKKWRVAVVVNDLINWSNAPAGPKWQTTWSAQYQLKKAHLCLGVNMNAQAAAGWGAALHIEVHKQLVVRLGTAQQPQLFSFGCTYKRKNFSCDVAFAWHQQLGSSPATSMGYAW